jgi:hypothetical protein
MIRVRPFPPSDPEFATRVRDALRRACGSDGAGIELLAPSEADLRKALPYVRERYPDVWIRRQDTMASTDGTEAWYTFRDETVTSGRYLEGRRTRA